MCVCVCVCVCLGGMRGVRERVCEGMQGSLKDGKCVCVCAYVCVFVFVGGE